MARPDSNKSIIVTLEPTGAAMWIRLDGVLTFIKMYRDLNTARNEARSLASDIRRERPDVIINEVVPS
jgi:hypothetical protein